MQIEDAIKCHFKFKCDKDAFGREISEEDIKIGQRILQMTAEEAERLSLERDKRVVLMAIKKQKPQKPKNIGSLGGEGIYFYGECPSCNNGVNYEMNYCSCCGQHLDWGETK